MFVHNLLKKGTSRKFLFRPRGAMDESGYRAGKKRGQNKCRKSEFESALPEQRLCVPLVFSLVFLCVPPNHPFCRNLKITQIAAFIRLPSLPDFFEEADGCCPFPHDLLSLNGFPRFRDIGMTLSADFRPAVMARPALKRLQARSVEFAKIILKKGARIF